MNVAIIGGGAAGFFAAIHVKINHPDARVVIIEQSKKTLTKVKISGGGRCNVTNGTQSISELARAYPRGGKKLKNAFRFFNNSHTMEWFESRGVPLVIQDDLCVFPVSQDSQSIIDCFHAEIKNLGIEIQLESRVSSLQPVDGKLSIEFKGGIKERQIYDKMIITTGGSPMKKGFLWLEKLNHKIEDPAPSLFTFNMPDEPIKELMGIVVEKALVSIQGTKLKGDGPLLITHWGMSGPAILKLSAFGARILKDKEYDFTVQVNWVNEPNNDLVLENLNQIVTEHSGKQLSNYRAYQLPERLWLFLLNKAEFSPARKWNELGKKGINKLVRLLTNDTYQVKGKTTFREEFVTCGGVSLDSVDFKTMQSKVCPHLYFAGELLDIDGITGGYNFQAAWTTAFIAAKLEG